VAVKDYGIKRIYRSTYNESFLVVPERYVIALDQAADEHLLTPSARLYTSIDLKDVHGVDNSAADFQFNIAPEVSQYQLLMIKKLILNNLPVSLNRTIEDIFVVFPETIRDPDKIVFDPVRLPTVHITGMGIYQNGVTGSKYFNLRFQNVSIGKGHAEWIAQQLKIKVDGHFPPPLTATVSFEVDSDLESAPESSIALSLNRISGNGLTARTDGNGAKTFLNRTLYDINVDSYETMAAVEQIQLAQALKVPANSIVSADSTGLSDDISLAAFKYAFYSNPDYINQILTGIPLVNLDTINDDIIVTNNT
jgi:hypothetical protein